MDQTNWVTVLNSTIKSLLSLNSSEFVSFGLAMASGLAVVLIVRYGIVTALSGRGFNMGDFLQEVVFLIAICLCILRGYSTPMSIFGGERFPDLIIDGPKMLANQITLTANAELELFFTNILNQSAAPNNAWDLLGLVDYCMMRLSIEGTRAVMFAITCWGLVAQAVIVLVGPVFIPFLLFRPLSFMFWGWFRSLLQYSFYPLICACFSSVLASFFVNLPLTQMTGTLSTTQMLALIPFLLIIILGMFAVPVVVSGLFSGSSSGGGISRLFS